MLIYAILNENIYLLYQYWPKIQDGNDTFSFFHLLQLYNYPNQNEKESFVTILTKNSRWRWHIQFLSSAPTVQLSKQEWKIVVSLCNLSLCLSDLKKIMMFLLHIVEFSKKLGMRFCCVSKKLTICWKWRIDLQVVNSFHL